MRTNTPVLVSLAIFPLTLHLPDKPQSLENRLAEGAVVFRWGNSKEGGWRWEPLARRCETRRPSCSPEGPPSFGCTRLCLAVGGPAWIWRLWSHPEGTKHSRSKRVLFAGTSCPAPRQFGLWTQDCSCSRHVTPLRSPRPTQNIVDTSFLFLVFN